MGGDPRPCTPLSSQNEPPPAGSLPSGPALPPPAELWEGPGTAPAGARGGGPAAPPAGAREGPAAAPAGRPCAVTPDGPVVSALRLAGAPLAPGGWPTAGGVDIACAAWLRTVS